MKYQNIQSLKKHFENPKNKDISSYLVVMPQEYERDKIITFILKHISSKKFNFTKFLSDKISLDEILKTFQSPSLLGGDPFVIINNFDSLSKDDQQKLTSYVKKHLVHLIIGSKNKQNVSALYNFVEKKGLIFDLSSEKPWEREKRFSEFILETCIKANKNISSNVIEFLFERVGLDLSFLEQEINKLITFVGDKRSIDLDDVSKICISNNYNTIWQLSEQIVWSKPTFDNFFIESSFFYGLLVSIRYQLQLGYKISSLVENKKTHDLAIFFPRIYPRTLQKKKEIATHLGSKYYKEALKMLFEIDLLSKNNVSSFSILLDMLKLKLLHLSSYANTTT